MVSNKASLPQRARADKDKALRRSQILAAGERLLLREGYHDIRMQDVAAEAGLAKGTSYLYFPSKEALFLALCLEHTAQWLAALEPLADRHQGNPDALASALAADLAEREVLRRLLALLHVVLEHNVGSDAARAFKLQLKQHSLSAAAMLGRALRLTPDAAFARLLDIHIITVGVQQAARPAPCIAALHREAEFAMFHIDLQQTLARLFRAVFSKQGCEHPRRNTE